MKETCHAMHVIPAKVLISHCHPVCDIVVIGMKTESDQDDEIAKEYRVVHTWGEADRQTCVSSLECLDGSQILISRKNGMVEIVDGGDCRRVWEKDAGGEVVSAHAMGESGGVVTVVRHDGVGRVYDVVDGDGSHVGEFRCPPKVTCSAHDGGSGRLAVGCHGAELKVYDMLDESRSVVFAGKGGKPNAVGLCDRPWNSAVAFTRARDDGSHIVVGTGYGNVRLYDTHVGRRPQLDVPCKGYRITCIAPERCGNRWWVGDASGNLQVYDVRAGAYQGAIKGIGGSVRSLDIHPKEPLIASVGLDRFVRVNSLQSSRSSVVRMYATSQLTAVGFLDRHQEQDKGEHIPKRRRKK